MHFIIYGEDSFRSRRALKAAEDRFRETRDASGFNVIRLRSEDGLIRAQEELFASPFLAERKLVVLEGFCRLSKPDQETLVESLGRKPETTVAVFFEPLGQAELAKSPLFATLANQKFSAEHQALTPAEANRFANQEAAAEQVKYEPTALRRLVEAVSTDSWRIHQETKKLAALAKGQGRSAITADDVDQMVSGSQEQSIFEYIDACTDGQGTKAMAALDRLMSAGEPELQVIARLQGHFRTLIMARDLMSRGLSQETAANKMGVHPFVAKKAWWAASRFEAPFLGACLRQLAKMEQALKSGGTRPRVSLDLFTAKLAAKACAISKR